jgi:CRP/FNR family cyclic AMP-dependent transcriptional regulator
MNVQKEKPSSLELGFLLLPDGHCGTKPPVAPAPLGSTLGRRAKRPSHTPAWTREFRREALGRGTCLPPETPAISSHRRSAYSRGLDRLKSARLLAIGATMTKPSAAPSRNSLKCIGILADLSPEAIEQIERRCTWKRYVPGEPILDYLDASGDVFFLTLGEVRVTIYSSTGKAVSFREMPAGEIFGEFPAIDGGSRSASVEAHTNCLVASMSGASFRDLLRSQPALARALLPRFTRIIRALTTRVYEFSTLAVNNRIQAELLRLASLGAKNGNSARIVPAPTHVEIANRVSTHREAVTRELARLARVGIIERRRGTLVIKNVDRLTEMVRDATGE